jgi:hypothetical protein
VVGVSREESDSWTEGLFSSAIAFAGVIANLQNRVPESVPWRIREQGVARQSKTM